MEVFLKKSHGSKNIVQLISYSFWGAITTSFNLTLFFLLNFLGVNYILANIVSYIFAVILNYFFNKIFVFEKNSSNKETRVFIKFIMVRAVSLLVDTILFYLLVSIMHFNVNVSRILLSFVIIVATFFVNKVFVFRPTKKEVVNCKIKCNKSRYPK
ncbi:GtrA family protein [Paenibacillus cisolokensis]|uniref:GtrA family protein n=1 Tax=Paenibacillus cisolokensis TaxID=1658519 RepID=UPI003D2CFE14